LIRKEIIQYTEKRELEGKDSYPRTEVRHSSAPLDKKIQNFSRSKIKEATQKEPTPRANSILYHSRQSNQKKIQDFREFSKFNVSKCFPMRIHIYAPKSDNQKWAYKYMHPICGTTRNQAGC
jgi:hypothetical protein